MSDDYRMRKDIDRFSLFLDNLETELKQKYGTSDLRNALSVFYDSSEVDVFINKLNNDLTDLNTSLDDLALDLYGDGNVEGFVDYLNELQHALYGKGDKDTSGREYTIDYPSPDSLKGLLNKLNSDMSDLSGTLTVLATYLVNFSGTLAEFKQLLASHGISYASLDTGITQLLEGIFQAQADINTVQDDIGDVSQISGTVVSNIQQVDDKAVDIRKKMYSGTNDTGTIDNPATGTVKANLNTAQGDIIDLDNMVGSVDVAKTGDLNNQTTWHSEALNQLLKTELSRFSPLLIIDYDDRQNRSLIIEYVNRGYTTQTIDNRTQSYEQWVNNGNDSFYRVIRDIPSGNINTSSLPSYLEYIGITYEFKSKFYSASQNYVNLIYEIKTNQFYKKSGNTWVVTTDVSDYFNSLQISQNIVDLIYPIGAIYMSMSNVEPSTLFGGTWQRLTDTFLFATSGIADTGTTAPSGQGEITHTLTTDEMPSHNHESANGGQALALGVTQNAETSMGFSGTNTSGLWANTPKARSNIANKGGGAAHNNMPPYMKVYMWKRTA